MGIIYELIPALKWGFFVVDKKELAFRLGML